MQNVYKNIAEYNSSRVHILLDDMIVDMISKKNLVQQ